MKYIMHIILTMWCSATVALGQPLPNELKAHDLEFTQFIASKRQPVFSSHIYTYYQEGFTAGSPLLIGTLKGDSIETKSKQTRGKTRVSIFLLNQNG